MAVIPDRRGQAHERRWLFFAQTSSQGASTDDLRWQPRQFIFQAIVR
jgi:hypothetical protein